MNNKGFTLVELLAMLAVLAILMAVAIPNITGILRNQKTSSLKNNAVTMVETAKTKVAKDELINNPTKPEECLVFSLNYLNDNDNLEYGPNGGKYDEYESFVIIKKECTGGCKYEYYVRLIENNENGKYFYGINTPTNIINVNKNDTTAISKIKDYQAYGLVENGTDNKTIVKNKTGLCSGGVINYYQRNVKKCSHESINGSDEDSRKIYYDANGNIVSSENDCIASGCSSC